MRITIVALLAVLSILPVRAASPFTGDWKLNVAQSSVTSGPQPKAGRALIEPDGANGYFQFTELVFGDAPAVRFTTHVQFDGREADSSLEDHAVKYASKQIDANTFEVAVRDYNTEQLIRTVRFSSSNDTLSIQWDDAGSEAIKRNLVFMRMPAGPVLQSGKPIEHTFGPAAVAEYRVHLDAAQYCEGKVIQKDGGVNMAAYSPDGARLRGFGGPPAGEKVFAFEAPVSGDYRIVLRSPAKPASSYSIVVDRIAGLEDRPE